ncbi:hypothetical protein ACFQU1_22720 [Chelatococcus sp. GCM10030263]|uniref:hypothetical protein n=1 Tax=Chelatococcus sp. GCM10030263 TaxID=3273387 RepID=UPI003623C143
MTQRWRMSVYDRSVSAEAFDLPPGPYRFIYVSEGQATVTSEAAEQSCGADDGLFATGPTRIAGEGRVWIYQVDPTGAPPSFDPSMILSHSFAPEFGGPWLMRADRIESPSGAATPRHGHRGPGIRRLLYGRLLAEVGEAWERIEAGQAWFETGRDPVIGTNIHTGNSAFVRVMVLPLELQGGKSSFMPASPEEAAKPRAVMNRLFGEWVIPT